MLDRRNELCDGHFAQSSAGVIEMNFRQMKTNEIGLLLKGLQTIYVADEEKTRAKLIKQLEGELSARGLKLVA